MGLLLGQVKDDCRWYINHRQHTFVTPELLVNAINGARMEWADRIRHPPLRMSIPVTTGISYVDVSSKIILDIDSIYYGSEDETCRMYPYDREGKDILLNNDSVQIVTLSADTHPTGYFWDQAQNRIQFLAGSGTYSPVSDTNIIIIYHGLPALYTTESSQDSLPLEIPIQYCYHIRHYVAHIVYNSKDNYDAAKNEYELWNAALLRAEGLQNRSRRDHPKTIKDAKAYPRQSYVDNY